MKKIKSEANDWLRPEYKRSDLGPIVRGKYARCIASKSNIARRRAAVLSTQIVVRQHKLASDSR